MNHFLRELCVLMFLFSIAGAVSSCGGSEDNKFTVGGNVAGLKGTLTLQVNGANDLTIVADGPYVLDVSFENNATYAVTVHTRPSNQNCNLANPSGTITEANVADVDVTCGDKAWTRSTGTTDAINPAGETSFFVQVAMSDNGDAVIVWPQSNGTHGQIFVSEYRNGSWTHPSDLNDNISPDGQHARHPRVAMDGQGNTIVVWSQANGAVTQIFESEYRDGQWSHPGGLTDFISSAAGGDAANPRVAMDENGNALVAWEQVIGGDSRILASQYRNGAWVHPASTSDHIDPLSGYSRLPVPVMDDHGDAIVAWQQNIGGTFQVFKSEYRNDTWIHPSGSADDISPDGQDTHDNTAAVDNQGNAIIVWDASDGTAAQVFKSEYRNGVWSHPADLNDNISPDGEWCSYPHVAMSDAGTALVVWAQENGGQDQAFLSEYRDGRWTHPAGLADHISPDGVYDYLDEPRVALDRHGNAVVAWSQSVGPSPSPSQIFKSEHRRGSWTHPVNLRDYISLVGLNAQDPEIAMDSNGDAIIVWHQEVAGKRQIFKAEYR